MAINKPLDAITETDLLELVSDSSPELKVLEFKRTLPGRSDGEKKEFLYDVASFANAIGGDLVYGIREEKGQAQELIGLQLEDADAEKLRLESQILSGIEPRIPGLRVHSISLSGSRYAFFIRIPRSWVGPHWVKFGGSLKFYSRTSAGKYLLDYGELRGLFVLGENRVEKLRQFRTERLGRIIANDTPVPLEEKAKVVLHILPLSAFDPSGGIRPAGSNGPIELWEPLAAHGYNRIRHNFDGLFNDSTPTGRAVSYLLLFRNGCIETVTTALTGEWQGRNQLDSQAYETQILEAIYRLRKLQSHFGIEPPHLLLLSLVGVKGYELSVHHRLRRFDRSPIDRDLLAAPEILVEMPDYNPAAVMRPAFDSVWNAAGWERSLNYDTQGEWKGQG